MAHIEHFAGKDGARFLVLAHRVVGMGEREVALDPQLEQCRVATIREGSHFGGIKGQEGGLMQTNDRRLCLRNVEQLARFQELFETC